MAERAEAGAGTRRLNPRPKTNADYEDTPSRRLQCLVQIGDDIVLTLKLDASHGPARFAAFSPSFRLRGPGTALGSGAKDDAAIESLLPIFRADHVPIVLDGEKFLGLITRIDLLNYLRRRMK